MRLSTQKIGLAGGPGFDPQCLKKGVERNGEGLGEGGKDSRGKVL